MQGPPCGVHANVMLPGYTTPIRDYPRKLLEVKNRLKAVFPNRCNKSITAESTISKATEDCLLQHGICSHRASRRRTVPAIYCYQKPGPCSCYSVGRLPSFPARRAPLPCPRLPLPPPLLSCWTPAC